jgi:hypothetical protein
MYPIQLTRDHIHHRHAQNDALGQAIAVAVLTVNSVDHVALPVSPVDRAFVPEKSRDKGCGFDPTLYPVMGLRRL